MKRLSRIGFVLTGLLGVAVAQDDEPGRGVARVSLINGEVSVKRGDSGDFVAAAINAPLVVQDQVVTGTVARAEIQMDVANYLRVGPNSDVRLTEIENQRYMIQLGRGIVTWRVRRDSNAEIDINTPSITVRPLRKGDYRVEVLNDGATQITVRDGEAEIYSPKGVQRLKEGRTMMVRGTIGDPEFQLTAEATRDDWDRWNDRRDQDLERSTSRQYMSQDVLGWEELDAHGGWTDVAPYGRVWRPRVTVDWAPYRNGQWSWLDYYGWTWVSYDQFGWAPFHHGRWFWNTGGWCWWPGGVATRNWWRPALVSWFGYGGAGIGVGFNRFGWVSLAPFEPFHPWYGSRYYRGGGFGGGFGGGNNIRIVNNYNIVNNYRNARVNGAVSAVEATHFGRRDRAQYDRVSDANLRSASLMQGQLPATPHRESLAFSGRESGIRGGGYDGPVYSRRQATQVERVPFENQRRGAEQVASRSAGGVAPEGGDSRRGDAGQSGRGNGAVAGGSARESGDGSRGWRRVGEAAGTGQRGEASGLGGVRSGDAMVGRDSSSRESVRGADSGGWRRFGEPGAATRGGGGETRGSVRGESAPEVRRGSDDSSRGAERMSTRESTGGWRRFGEPTGVRGESGARGGDAVMPESGGSRSGGRVYGATPESGAERGRSSDPSWRRLEGNAGGSSRGSSSGAGSARRGNDGIQVSPPLIYDRSSERSSERSSSRERSVPRDSGGGGYRGGGSFPSSSPSSAPSVDRSGGERSRGGFGGFSGGSRQSAPSSSPSMDGGSRGGSASPRGGGGDSSSGARSSGGGGRSGGDGGRSGGGGSRRN